MSAWWKRHNVGPPTRPVWSPPDPVPDGDTVLGPGQRHWADLLHPAGEEPAPHSAWLHEPTRPLPLISPLMTPGQRHRADGGLQP